MSVPPSLTRDRAASVGSVVVQLMAEWQWQCATQHNTDTSQSVSRETTTLSSTYLSQTNLGNSEVKVIVTRLEVNQITW